MGISGDGQYFGIYNAGANSVVELTILKTPVIAQFLSVRKTLLFDTTTYITIARLNLTAAGFTLLAIPDKQVNT